MMQYSCPLKPGLKCSAQYKLRVESCCKGCTLPIRTERRKKRVVNRLVDKSFHEPDTPLSTILVDKTSFGLQSGLQLHGGASFP